MVVRQVCAELEAMGLEPKLEARTRLGYTVDAMVVTCDAAGGVRRVAIEVDGPSHFVGGRPSGATRLKRRQLARHGWDVVSVTPAQWEGLRLRSQRHEFLKKAIARATPTPLASAGAA